MGERDMLRSDTTRCVSANEGLTESNRNLALTSQTAMRRAAPRSGGTVVIGTSRVGLDLDATPRGRDLIPVFLTPL